MTRMLTFNLAGELYGVDIRVVHEIISALPITRVPLAPYRVRGVINLRGSVIPVIDLKREFHLDESCEESFCVVVVRVNGVDFGVIVDHVSDVVEVAEDTIQATPDFIGDRRRDFVRGLVHLDARICLIIDIEEVLLAEATP